MSRMVRKTAEFSVFVAFVLGMMLVAAGDASAQAARPAQRISVTANMAGKHPKLTTPLAQLASSVSKTGSVAMAALPEPSRSAVSHGQMKVDRNGAVQVYIRVSELSAGNFASLNKAGVKVQLTDRKRNIIQAAVPTASLESVAALSFVNSVSLPQYGNMNTGSATTQGDTILKADKVRSQLGVTGKGVRVGVLADGIASLFATGCTTCGALDGGPMATSDVPTATGTRNAGGVLTATDGGIVAKSFRASDGDLEAGLGGVGQEGTAMIEVIHDLAPDATIYFANFQTDIEFNDAMNWLAANTDVVVDDASFFDQPYDGTNFVSANAATALNTDGNPVRAVITAVGNEAQSHYLETFADSGVDAGPSVSSAVPGYVGNFHQFQATTNTKDVCGLGPGTKDPVFVRNGWPLNVTMTWDDPDVSTNDYDLWLVDAAGNVVGHSTNLQNGGLGGQLPLEFIEYVNNTGTDAFYYIAITNANNAAAAKKLNVFIRGADPIGLHAAQMTPVGACTAADAEVHNFNTPGGSVPAMGDAGGTPVSVISVGAVPASDPMRIQGYSSNGPTVDGRTKPDLTAVDQVAISLADPNLNPFWGTSASAPHVAGIAALLLQASPCLTGAASGSRLPSDARKLLYDTLTKNAFDLGAAGPDNVFGYGLVDALSSATALLPVASAGGDKVVAVSSASGASVALDGSGSTDPGSCPLTYTWSGDCGTATGASVSLNCPVGKSNVTLTVSNNGGVTTSTATSSITVTDFAVAATTSSATVAAGGTATYTVSVSPQGGAFGNPVSLACTTTAPHGVCTVTPATVTPGSAPANATVNVTTTSTASGNYAVTLTATSNTLTRTQALTLAVSDFKIAATSNTATVNKGSTANYSLTVGPDATGGNFGAAVALTCTGAPTKATCTVSPTSVTPGAAGAAVTVSVTTTPQTTAALHAPELPSRRGPAGLVFATFAIFGIALAGTTRSRRVKLAIMLLVLFAALMMLSACGGGGGSSTPKPPQVVDQGTPAGTYTLTVIGTSGLVTHSTSLTLVVQ